MEVLHKTFPSFLLILSQTFIILCFTRIYKDDFESGVLLFLLGNRGSMVRYTLLKMVDVYIKSILPLVFLTCCMFYATGTQLEQLYFFGASQLILSTITFLFTQVMGALTLRPSQNDIQSLIIVYPFLVPSLILALSALNSQAFFYERLEVIYLNFGILMLTFGIVLLVIPRLLVLTFDD